MISEDVKSDSEDSIISTAYYLADELGVVDDIEVEPDTNPAEPFLAYEKVIMWFPPNAHRTADIDLSGYAPTERTTFNKGYPTDGGEYRLYMIDIEDSEDENALRTLGAGIVDRIADALHIPADSLLEEIRIHSDPTSEGRLSESIRIEKPPVIDLSDVHGHHGKIAVAPRITDYMPEN